MSRMTSPSQYNRLPYLHVFNENKKDIPQVLIGINEVNRNVLMLAFDQLKFNINFNKSVI